MQGPKLIVIVIALLVYGPVQALGAESPAHEPADTPPPSHATPAADRSHAPDVDGLDFRRVVAEAKAKVFPAVLYIKCVRENLQAGKKQTEEVAGSGVIVSPDGLSLTNWHVVDKAVEVRCLLSSGESLTAKVLGTDKDTDLALLGLARPDGAPPLPHAELGDSALLQEGDFVMAMGAPWGLNRSVSIGIVACAKRFLPERSEYSLWLQTDASISPGNSGGPLVSTEGKVIGINALATSGGGDLGFAIPSETISILLPQFVEHGKVDWSWTGIRLQPLRDFDRNIYFDAKEGVIVAETDPESPGRVAGLLPRDRIVRVNGEPTDGRTDEDLPAIRRKLGLLPKGAPALLDVVRGEEALRIEIVPREKGRVEGEELACPRWNLTVKAINQFDNPDLYFYRKGGVFVYGLRYPGNARAAGLAEKDIVLKIHDRDVATLQDVTAAYEDAMDKLSSQTKVRVMVLRNGLVRQMVLDFSRDYEKE